MAQDDPNVVRPNIYQGRFATDIAALNVSPDTKTRIANFLAWCEYKVRLVGADKLMEDMVIYRHHNTAKYLRKHAASEQLDLGLEPVNIDSRTTVTIAKNIATAGFTVFESCQQESGDITHMAFSVNRQQGKCEFCLTTGPIEDLVQYVKKSTVNHVSHDTSSTQPADLPHNEQVA